MKSPIQKNPEDFILSVLSDEARLDAAVSLAREAFKQAKITAKDIDHAVKAVRKGLFSTKQHAKHSR
ncbi:MAG: hypothetical protein HYU97_10220 [Deltaproteobacteria bacterium]|nr:hypothetical protein [Deltaproteobacteria bacterium]